MTNCTRLSPSAARVAIALALLALMALALMAPPASHAVDMADAASQHEVHHQVQEGEGGSDPEANLPFLFSVFIITWALFFAYVVYMTLKRRAMEREIEALRASLNASTTDGEGGEDIVGDDRDR